MVNSYIKYVNDNAYIVKRETPIHNFIHKNTNQIDMELLASYRDWLGCDHVLRSQTHFLFCETIQDAEILVENV